MKRISAIAMSLLLIIGLTVEAQAVTSGTYRCVAAQGSLDFGSTVTIPLVVHYNPNLGVQSITRIRVFDGNGVLLFDETFPVGAVPVPGRGSIPITAMITGVLDGTQLIVNWRQSADAAAPIPRLNLLTVDGVGVLTSVSQSNCP